MVLKSLDHYYFEKSRFARNSSINTFQKLFYYIIRKIQVANRF